jgi:hypothetical protein
MKRIKHRDLTHYFITDHQYLPRAYVASCERFFKSFKLQAARTRDQVTSGKLQAASVKQQA